MILGAVDIGTNTVRLLVAEAVEGTLGQELARRAVVTRLGQGVDEAGALHPLAIARTVESLLSYGAILDDLGVVQRRVVGTSAMRDATNSQEFLDMATAALGVCPEVISGAEEARLSFRGANLGREVSGPVLVVDLGGGSTEFVVGTTGPVYAHSVDIGSVRLMERYLPDLPAPAESVERARRHVAQLFRDELELPPVGLTIGVAGTFTTLGAIYLELPAYDREAVDGTVMTTDVLRGLIDRLATMTLEEIAAIPSMAPGRAAVILAGAVVAEQALAASGLDELTVSERDILEGIALSMLT